MPTLVFDTETSGLVKRDVPPSDPSQPHLVQLGAKLYGPDWRARGSLVVLIRPDGWSIEPQAYAVHGISEMDCIQFGVSLREAMVAFRALVENATEIVAYNLFGFDRIVLEASIHRAGGQGTWWSKKAPIMRCAMEASARAMGKPSPYGGDAFPSLEDAYGYFAGPVQEGRPYVRHDAEQDLEACAWVWRSVRAQGG